MPDKITGVRITPGTIQFVFNGVPIYDRYHVNPRVPMVGHYKQHEPIVLVDRKIPDRREQEAILIHEAIERHLRFDEGLGPLQAHRIAERDEHNWAIHHGVDWMQEGIDVECVFRANYIPGQRRRR
jgi:hypothetical protein